MAQAPRTRLEQHAQTAHLSIREFVDRFHDAAIKCGEGKAHISEPQAKRWFAGESDLPRPVCRRVLEHWWAEPVSCLFGPPDSGRVAVLMSEELIVNAGRESVDHAIKAASALDPSALEHLYDDAQHAARGVLRDAAAGDAHRPCPPSRHRVRAAGPHAQAAPTSRAVPARRADVRSALLGVLGPGPTRRSLRSKRAPRTPTEA